jgi:formylglycine-generating enzyme required for sulfatase activity
LVPIPITKFEVSIAEGYELPPGVRLRNLKQPGESLGRREGFRLTYEFEPGQWPDQRIDELYEQLAKVVLSCRVEFRAARGSSNIAKVTLSRSAGQKVYQQLKGESVPRGDTRFVTRNGRARVIAEVKNNLTVRAWISDYERWNSSLTEQVVKLFMAKVEQLGWADYQAAMKNAAIEEDIQPDKLVYQYNQEQGSDAQVERDLEKLGIMAKASGWGVKAAGSVTRESDDFSEFAKNNGLIVEKEGEFYYPKAVEVNYLSTGAFDQEQTFVFDETLLVSGLMDEPFPISLHDAVRPLGAVESVVAAPKQLAHAAGHRQVLKLVTKESAEGRPEQTVELSLRWCPAGKFIMGSPPDEINREINEQTTDVIIDRGFFIGEHEVTRELYEAVMGPSQANPIPAPTGERDAMSMLPISGVKFEECETFCRMLTEKLAKVLPPNWKFRLPTEAEWEYACRAGTIKPFSIDGGVDIPKSSVINAAGWFRGLVPVHDSRCAANPWGIRHMHGNVAEFVADGYSPRVPGGINPLVVEQQPRVRILRGGGWRDPLIDCRSANRIGGQPDEARDQWGFRVVAVPGDMAMVLHEFDPAPVRPTPVVMDLQKRHVEIVGKFHPVGKQDLEIASGRSATTINCETSFFFSDSQVHLLAWFSCQEQGGNKTTIQGYEPFLVFDLPEDLRKQGKRIVGMKGPPGWHTNWRKFEATNQKGQRVEWRPFTGLEGTGWISLDYLPDGPDGRDDQEVGVKGVLSDYIKVLVE